MKNGKAAQFILLIAIVYGVDCYTKQWIHTNLWDDPSNWEPNRLPCVHGKVEMLDGAIFISNGSILSNEIVLASDGEIIFPMDSSINLGPPKLNQESEEKKCDSSVFKYSQRSWNNPMNWVISSSSSNNFPPDSIPFIERIPCKNDQVQFPDHGAFSVKIERNVKVKSILLKGEVMEDNNFLKVYLSTVGGKENFIMEQNERLQIASSACPQEGCMCRDDKDSSYICSSFQCPLSTCLRKVTSYKDCCSHCGAIAEFTFKAGFDFKKCHNSLLSKFQDANVFMYMSRILKDKIEILFTDISDGSNAEIMMTRVAEELRQPGDICNASLVTEKNWKSFNADQAVGGDNSASATTITLAIIIPLAIIVIAIIVLAYYYRKRQPREIKNKRLEEEKEVHEYPGFNEMMTTDFTGGDYQAEFNLGDDPPLDSGEGNFAVLDVGFSNPLYETQVKEKAQAEMETVKNKNKKSNIPDNDHTTVILSEDASTPSQEESVQSKPLNDIDVENNHGAVAFNNPLYTDVENEFSLAPVDVGPMKTLYDDSDC